VRPSCDAAPMRTISNELQHLLLAAMTPLIDLLAPARCGICGHEGTPLCADCRADWIPALPERITVPELDAAAALGPYEGGLGEAIRTLKYGGVPSLARELGAALHPAIALVTQGAPSAATLVPIPTDATRIHERGFDHALLLAESASITSGRPCAQFLVRTRATAALHDLSRAERAVALSGAMAVTSERTIPPAVVLIDDTTTTGATMREAARALRAAGSTWIAAVSVAHER